MVSPMSENWRVSILISHCHPKYCCEDATVEVSGIDSDGKRFTADEIRQGLDMLDSLEEGND